MNTDILQAIATGLVTILGFFMFYDSKKRTEAAAGCVGWFLSVCGWITFVIALIYTIYLVVIDFFKVANRLWYIGNDVKFHPWYWLEIVGFADVFLTYLFMEISII